jgi:hypothetical protein
MSERPWTFGFIHCGYGQKKLPQASFDGLPCHSLSSPPRKVKDLTEYTDAREWNPCNVRVYKWRCVMYCTSGINQWMLGGYLILLLTFGSSFWCSRIREPWILVFLVLRNIIKEPWVLVISKTSKNWQSSSQNQRFYRPSFSVFQKFENYGDIYIYIYIYSWAPQCFALPVMTIKLFCVDITIFKISIYVILFY